jgi:hypothetical protein
LPKSETPSWGLNSGGQLQSIISHEIPGRFCSFFAESKEEVKENNNYARGKLGRVENSAGRVFGSFFAQNAEKTHFYTSLNKPQLDLNIHNFH